LLVASAVLGAQDKEAPPNPEPDIRYKVDVLVVVGHPDDDIEVASYVAKLIEQEHKKVAVIYTTRGNSGGTPRVWSRLPFYPTFARWRLGILSDRTGSRMPGSCMGLTFQVATCFIHSKFGDMAKLWTRSYG